MDGAPGFYGKLPSHGDFVGRRLPPDVRDCFDRWLQAALVRSKADLGQAWLPTWLSSPLWRFVGGPGVCGEQAWAGVMMPSHDRVGRCFPLLLAAPINGMLSLRDCLTLHDGWYQRLEGLALSTLEADFSLKTFDATLVAMAGACPRPSESSFRSTFLQTLAVTPLTASVAPLPAHAQSTMFDNAMEAKSAWWTDGSPQLAPCLAVYPGLPAPTAFVALLDGYWMRHGWAVRDALGESYL